MIHIRKLEKSYVSGGRHTPILRSIDLDIPRGSFAVLLGPSGCGKTTLLNLIGALDVPDSGELRVADIVLYPVDRRSLLRYRRTEVGVIFQFYNLLPTLTARENVELVLEPLGLSTRERGERALAMLTRVGLAQAIDQFPGQLSGGEQQRVAIARALAKQPALILADEPTGSLDRENSRQIVALMHKLNRENGLTFLIVSHDPELAAQATLVLHMEDGRLLPAAPTAPINGPGPSV